jgi:hypothetical protein
MAAMVLLNGCASPPNFSEMRINVPSDYSRSILNLQNDSKLNATGKQWSERLMKSGFLDTSTEEYGYFEIEFNRDSFYEETPIVMVILSSLTVGVGFPVWALLGIPTSKGECLIYASLKIYDSNKNLVKSYYESEWIEKYAGLYYSGDMTKKAGKEFEKMFKTILDTAKMESSQINRALREAGPVTAEKERARAERIAAERKEAREREANRPVIITPPQSSEPSAPAQPAPAPAPSTPTLQTGRYAYSGSNVTMTLNVGIVSLYVGNNVIGIGHGTYRINGNQLVVTIMQATGDYSFMSGTTYAYTITSNTSFSGSRETWVRTGSY